MLSPASISSSSTESPCRWRGSQPEHLNTEEAPNPHPPVGRQVQNCALYASVPRITVAAHVKDDFAVWAGADEVVSKHWSFQRGDDCEVADDGFEVLGGQGA
ncbi:hypothetical protein PG990_007461 [Apiospora arundinis]